MSKTEKKTKTKTKNKKKPNQFSFSTLSYKPFPTECPSFLLPMCVSIHSPDFLILYVFFLCSLPVNWLLAPPLDLWLILFNLVYNKQKALGLKLRLRLNLTSHLYIIEKNIWGEKVVDEDFFTKLWIPLSPLLKTTCCLYWGWETNFNSSQLANTGGSHTSSLCCLCCYLLDSC